MSDRLADRPSELEPERRRVTAGERERLLLAAAARAGGDHSTVELSRNARGATQITVKVRTGEPGIDTAVDAAERACELYDNLRELYPDLEQKGAGNGA